MIVNTEILDRFRRAQRVAYDAAETVGAELRPGMREIDAARAMAEHLERAGIDGWFHRPFAWFGDRTAFAGIRTPLGFFPTRRKLEPGMPYILDVAPIVNGAGADIGYAGVLGSDRTHARMMRDLGAYRALILEGVRAGRALRDIYRDVDALAAKQGYRQRHQRYPLRVLAHKVALIPHPRRTVAGFGIGALAALARAALLGPTPFWNDARTASKPASPGLWAVEPHVALGGIGVKFEELLVVTESGAHWLDDDLPHVRIAERAA